MFGKAGAIVLFSCAANVDSRGMPARAQVALPLEALPPEPMKHCRQDLF